MPAKKKSNGPAIATVDVFEQVEAAPKGVEFSSAELNEISQFFGGGMIKSAADLIAKLKQSQEVRFAEGVAIDLTTDDLWSIKQQSLGMGVPYDEYFKKFISDAVRFELQGWRVR